LLREIPHLQVSNETMLGDFPFQFVSVGIASYQLLVKILIFFLNLGGVETNPLVLTSFSGKSPANQRKITIFVDYNQRLTM